MGNVSALPHLAKSRTNLAIHKDVSFSRTRERKTTLKLWDSESLETAWLLPDQRLVAEESAWQTLQNTVIFPLSRSSNPFSFVLSLLHNVLLFVKMIYKSLWVSSPLWGLYFISVRTHIHICNKPSPVYLSLVISICRAPGTELKRVEEKQFSSPTLSSH